MFGAGIDHAGVRTVVHMGVPRNAVDFAQEVGRGGRDGEGCLSYVMIPRGWRASSRRAGGELMAADELVMQTYIDSPRCRQTALREFLDGLAYVCEDARMMCDRCQRLGMVPREKGKVEERADGERRRLLEPAGGGEEWGEGARQLIETRKRERRDKRAFIANLELVRGMCGLCLVEGGLALARGHTLDTCSGESKFRFFSMRKMLKQKHGSKWMAPYSGCAGCGLSQGICAELGVGRCEYKDLAIPISWGVYTNARWEGVRESGRQAGLLRARAKPCVDTHRCQPRRSSSSTLSLARQRAHCSCR